MLCLYGTSKLIVGFTSSQFALYYIVCQLHEIYTYVFVTSLSNIHLPFYPGLLLYSPDSFFLLSL